ncbi:hypothetical protein DOW55_23945 [Salmonella enterica subsp. enterica serovar Bareilly]|nr:hypothetical protein [Salmonella enterica subsp. enterica serovar Bareilly]EBX5888806.1 hypothetical protein [Salmonella enterica subsp. enterica serovar Reading]ECB0695864.1 hypothetical protein [Salmonella enterica subsp. enterica serovar Poona]ECE6269421.1 hypothetical protein [Salmonella enterica subsp. diarizonae]ECG2245055.1 hypothetical protein [Salmonella enterica subsp. enterica serovar Poona]
MRMFYVVKYVDFIVVIYVLKNVVKVLLYKRCKDTFLLVLNVKQQDIFSSLLPEGNRIRSERQEEAVTVAPRW